MQNNDKNIEETVEIDDAKLKKGLCELMSSLTAHTAAIPELRNDVKCATAQVTRLIAKASFGQTPGLSLIVFMAALESRFQRLQEHIDNSLKGPRAWRR